MKAIKVKVFQYKKDPKKAVLKGTIKRVPFSQSGGFFGGDREPGIYMWDSVMIEPGPINSEKYSIGLTNKNEIYLQVAFGLPKDIQKK